MTEPRKGGESAYRIGIDVGGTFTDVVLIENSTGDVSVAKRLNRHDDRTETVVEAVERLLDRAGVTTEQLGWISHGTTIATNAVIERKGAKTALITNRNFRDILEIGRFARPPELIYRIHEDKPAPLVPRRLRLGVAGRIDRHGAVVADLDEADLDRAIAALPKSGSTASRCASSSRSSTRRTRKGCGNASGPRFPISTSCCRAKSCASSGSFREPRPPCSPPTWRRC